MTQTQWRERKLGDVLTLQRGFDLPKKKRKLGDIPIVSSSGVSGYHEESKVGGPGVVTGRYGTLGEVFYIKEDFWPLNTTLYVRDFKGNDPLFLSYFLKTLNLAYQNTAGAVPGLNRNALHLLSVTVPPVPTQRKIASILSAYDDLIENNTRRIEILEEMAQTIYREWFVNFRFPGHEKVKMVESELGLIPEGWEVTKASDAMSMNPRTRVPKEGEKPFVPMGSLSHKSMLITGIETRSGNSGSKFKNGDTLFARITPSLENGKTGHVQFLPFREAVAFGSTEFIVLRSETLSPEYIYLMARSDEFRDNAIKSMTGASGRQRVQEESFDKFLLAHPRQEALEEFSEIVSPMFRQIQIASEKNDCLRRTRDLLLPKLISGEVDVENLNSDTREDGN